MIHPPTSGPINDLGPLSKLFLKTKCPKERDEALDTFTGMLLFYGHYFKKRSGLPEKENLEEIPFLSSNNRSECI